MITFQKCQNLMNTVLIVSKIQSVSPWPDGILTFSIKYPQLKQIDIFNINIKLYTL